MAGIAFAQMDTGRMRDCMDVFVLADFHEPFGQLFGTLFESAVDGGDDKIKFAQNRIIVIQIPNAVYFYFRSKEDVKILQLRVEIINLLFFLLQVFRANTAGHPQARRMVADGQILVSFRPRRLRHLRDRVMPVRPRGMDVQVTLDVVQFDQRRGTKFYAPGEYFLLAEILAHLRRHVRQAQRLETIFLRFSGEHLLPPAFEGKNAVFVDLHIFFNGDLAQFDIEILRAGKIQQRRAETFRLHHPDIDLDVVSREDRGFGFPVGVDAFDLRQGDEDVHDFRRFRRINKDVDVAHRFTPAAQTSRGGDLLDLRQFFQGRDELLRHLGGRAQMHPLLPFLDDLQAATDIPDRFFLNTGQARQLSRLNRLAQIHHAFNLQLVKK